MKNTFRGLILCATALVTSALAVRATAAEFPTDEINKAVTIYDAAQSWFAKSGAVQTVVKSQTFDWDGKLLHQYTQKDRWFLKLPNYRCEREYDSGKDFINKRTVAYDGKVSATLNQNVKKNGERGMVPGLVYTKDQDDWTGTDQYFILFGVSTLQTNTTVKELLLGMKNYPEWTITATEKDDLLSIAMSVPSVTRTFTFRTKGDRGLVAFTAVNGKAPLQEFHRCDIIEYKMSGSELRPTRMYMTTKIPGHLARYVDVQVSEIAAEDRPADPFRIEPQNGWLVSDRDGLKAYQLKDGKKVPVPVLDPLTGKISGGDSSPSTQK